MKNIICDTNIWYDIATGKIKTETISKLNLFGTAINIVEIASTPNLKKNIKLVRQTIKALKKHHFIIIGSNPFDHLLWLFDPSFEPKDEQVINLLNDFEIFDKNEILDDLSCEEWDIMNDSISENLKRKSSISEFINDALSQSQTIIKNNSLRKSYISKSYKDSWKHFFFMIITNYYKDKYGKDLTISENDINWKQLDFFLTAWDEYLKHLDVHHGSKFKNNDWFDILNLVYVQPEFKFWTNEKKSWAKLLKGNKVVKPYIFNNSVLEF